MKYMLLIYGDEDSSSRDEAARQSCYTESAKLVRELQTTGQFIEAAPLEPTSSSTSVQVREGSRIVTDGPFAETKEQLGGYFLVEAANLDEAINIARQNTWSALGNR